MTEFNNKNDSNHHLGVSLCKDDTGSGALVMRVTPDSPADAADIRIDDRIIKVDSWEIASSAALPDVLKNKAGDNATFELLRDGETVLVDVKFSTTPNDSDNDKNPPVSSNKHTGGMAFGVGVLAYLASAAPCAIVTLVAFSLMHGVPGYALGGGPAHIIVGICIGLWWKKHPEISVIRAAGRAIWIGLLIGLIIIAILTAYINSIS